MSDDIAKLTYALSSLMLELVCKGMAEDVCPPMKKARETLKEVCAIDCNKILNEPYNGGVHFASAGTRR